MTQATRLTWGVLDHNENVANSYFHISKLAAVDFQVISDAVDGFQTILANITRGNIGRMTVVDPRDTGLPIGPNNPEAQNEIRLRMDYIDNVTFKRSHFTIGCPELSNILTSESNIIDIDNSTDVLALKDWFEQYGRSDVENAVTVTGAMIVGRTSG